MVEATRYRERTALILLGASAFPKLPDVVAMDSLRRSSRAFKEYMLHQSDHLGLSSRFVLDLFDSMDSPGLQTEQIEELLDEFMTESSSISSQDRSTKQLLNVVISYVGHGLIVGEASNLALAVRYTKDTSQTSSSIAMTALADVVKSHATYARRFVFLDCCFAAKALRDWQPGDASVALSRVLAARAGEAFDARETPRADSSASNAPETEGPPTRGTALICAAGKDDVALATSAGGLTLFTGALLDGLGTSRSPRVVSLQDICDRTWYRIQTGKGRQVRPQVYSTDQREGDIARYPFFLEYSVPRASQRGSPEQCASDSADGSNGSRRHGAADEESKVPQTAFFRAIVGRYRQASVRIFNRGRGRAGSSKVHPLVAFSIGSVPMLALVVVAVVAYPDMLRRVGMRLTDLMQTPARPETGAESTKSPSAMNSGGSRSNKKVDAASAPSGARDVPAVGTIVANAPVAHASGASQPASAAVANANAPLLADNATPADYKAAIKQATDAKAKRLLREKARTALAPQLNFGHYKEVDNESTNEYSFLSYVPRDNVLKVKLRRYGVYKGDSPPSVTNDFDAIVTIHVGRLQDVVQTKTLLRLFCAPPSNGGCVSYEIVRGFCYFGILGARKGSECDHSETDFDFLKRAADTEMAAFGNALYQIVRDFR